MLNHSAQARREERASGWAAGGVGGAEVGRSFSSSHVNQQISLNYVRVLCRWIAHYVCGRRDESMRGR